MQARIPQLLSDLFAKSDIKMNGDRPWDIQVHNPDVFQRIVSGGSLAAGESYMDGWWDCQALDEMLTRMLRYNSSAKLRTILTWPVISSIVYAQIVNLQSRARAFQVGEHHYNIGNDVFEAMLDAQMNYSCGYWERANDLDAAQIDKMELLCRKLQLRPGEKLLDIGCGWGGLAAHAARHYGVSVVGLTVSSEQQVWAREKCAGLPVEILLQDYRDCYGQFDKIVSVGMFEHVGSRNYRTYFDKVGSLLKRDGLFVMQTIGETLDGRRSDPWINRYIFPNGEIPSRQALLEGLPPHIEIEDWHNFGRDYDRTLMAWLDRFDAAWPRLSHRYDERFCRMWRYYLCLSAAFFRSRKGYLWQLVMTHQEAREQYRSVRLAAA